MYLKSLIFIFIVLSSFFSQSQTRDISSKYFKKPSVIKSWKLDSLSKTSKKNTFKIQKHYNVYVVFTSNLNGMNEAPASSNPINTSSESIDLDNNELKFQISFKTLALKNIFKSKLDLWFAYTQSSRWQIFNEDISRPFRETNYQPEAIFIHPINVDIGRLNWSYLGLSFNHQSNGRSLPFSRSWNRIIIEAGFQGNNYTIQLRPWFRLNEDPSEDDNPDIDNFIGRGELLFTYAFKRIRIQTNLRHSLRSGSNSRGSLNIHLDYKLQNELSLNFQIFHGYGENMLDYNFKQTMLSIGASFL